MRNVTCNLSPVTKNYQLACNYVVTNCYTSHANISSQVNRYTPILDKGDL